MEEACSQCARIKEPRTVRQPESRRCHLLDTDVLIALIDDELSSENLVQIDDGRETEKETRQDERTLMPVKWIASKTCDQYTLYSDGC